MSNWLARGSLPYSIEDKITIAILRRLKADPILLGLTAGGGGIVRRHTHYPLASGRAPRLVVGSMVITEQRAFSRLTKGEHRVTIMAEFEQFGEELADDDIGIHSLLAYIRGVVEGGPPYVEKDGRSAPYMLPDPFDRAVALNAQPVTWELGAGVPNNIEGAPTAFYVGMEAVVIYKARTFDRQPFTGGTP